MLWVWRCNKKLTRCPSAPSVHYITWNCQTATPYLTHYCCRTANPSQHITHNNPLSSAPANFINTSYLLTNDAGFIKCCLSKKLIYKSCIWQNTTFLFVCEGYMGQSIYIANVSVIFLRNVNMNKIKNFCWTETFLSISLQLHTLPRPPLPVIKSAEHYNHRTTYQHSDHRTTGQHHKEPPCDLFPPAWQLALNFKMSSNTWFDWLIAGLIQY